MTTLYFVRHGKVDNPENIFYGRLPRMKLSALGRKQIKESAKYFKDIPVAKIYSSNLLRARQSADILASEIDCKHISRSNLITDVNSYMEGKPFEEGKASRFDHYFSTNKNQNMKI